MDWMEVFDKNDDSKFSCLASWFGRLAMGFLCLVGTGGPAMNLWSGRGEDEIFFFDTEELVSIYLETSLRYLHRPPFRFLIQASPRSSWSATVFELQIS